MLTRLDIEDLVAQHGENVRDTCCDVGQCQGNVAAYYFHPDYPYHTYTVCDEHDSEATVEQLVADWKRQCSSSQ